MSKIKSSVVFKQYSQEQNLLLPPNLGELIGDHHLVRVVNEVVERMDISEIINLYKGGGASAYNPRMLLKVLLYAYAMKIYTGRRIAKALCQDIHFMWLSAMSRPDFRTINNFRSGKCKDVIEVLFKEVLEFLLEQGYIKMENYFCDGSTLRADANQHKMVWKKNAQRYKEQVEAKCHELFKQIDELNNQEEVQYGKADLEENGNTSVITKEAIDEKVSDLNKKIGEVSDKSTKRKATAIKKKLVETKKKIDKYDKQIETAGQRSGYSKTDKDATAMMMKNRVEILPAYNILAGSENQFITGVSVHQNTNDGVCFKEHLEQIADQQPFTADRIIADSIFGTEQNYVLLEQTKIENYLKFPSYHPEQKKSNEQNPFLKDNFTYDVLTDTYSCPNGQLLVYQKTVTNVHNRTGYESVLKEYECESCAGCPFYDKCCKSSQGVNRTIHVNEKLENYKQQVRENLGTEKGTQLKKQRSIEIESCFGDIKHNMGFRRFHLRGLDKVSTEFSLIAIAHNIRKVHIQRLQKAA